MIQYFRVLLLCLSSSTSLAISGGFDAYGLEGAKGVALIDNGYWLKDPSECTGAILNNRIIITNGFCCGKKFTSTVVHVCSTSPFERGPFFNLEAFMHLGTSENDHFRLCLIRLDDDIQFNDDCVPLALPTADSDVNSKDQVLIAFGYGSVQLDVPKDIDGQNVLNILWRRTLADDQQAIEYPIQDQRYCNPFFDRPHAGVYELMCHGSIHNRTERLMRGDNGAPVVGSKDNVMYTIMSTQYDPKKEFVWENTTFPMFGINVYSARLDILAGMAKLMKDVVSNGQNE